MLVRWLVFSLLASLCAGVSCQVMLPDDDLPGIGYVQLDRATVEMVITAPMQATTAEVTASIRRNGLVVRLQSGQEISVNGLALEGPGLTGLYSRSVPRAAAYIIRVSEPTLGTNETTVAAPADFAIDSPASGQGVSLSDGFALAWSQPTPGLTTMVTLTQMLGSVAVEARGPLADELGGLNLAAGDLTKFRQGADLGIKVAKTAHASSIEGLAGGTVRVELSQALSVVPGP